MRKCLNCKCYEQPAPYTCCAAPRFRKPNKLTQDQQAKVDKWNAMLAKLEEE